MIERFYTKEYIAKNLKPNSVLMLYGPRQVGKTTLIENFLSSYDGKFFSGFGEDSDLREILEPLKAQRILTFFANYDLIFIDEAQKIKNIGEALKILVDHGNDVKIIATGSSSFELEQSVGEPLVGRSEIMRLFPISALELSAQYGNMYLHSNLENLLIYGSYPDTLNASSYDDKQKYLLKLINQYLYKDILEIDKIRNTSKIADLLTLIAYQIGKEVSLAELGNALDISKNTVAKYIDLLEKSFILIKVRGFSRNLRKEVTKMHRYYFYDNGVRNAIIKNFNFIKNRDDIGALWENFLFMERFKKRHYEDIYANEYFWRTYDKTEVDLVEERDGKLYGYEFKWGNKIPKAPKQWLGTYDNARYEVINRDNYLEFIALVQ